jgi:formylglycine-generating enzyme required for sulfatase activity
MGTSPEVEEQLDRLSAVLGSKYHVICPIGGGGMAQVYLARHRLHGGLFAVKVLVDYLAQDERIVARFEQEARMAATLAAHPNIVPIFDIGSGGRLHYMIMQFIPGEDLASYLRREQRLSLPDAANVVVQAVEALSCAEARRIVHRDLKPANMLLDESGRIKLLDFGISRIADVADGLTRPGECPGTPFYMSPEQIRGEACDIRSDLYSMGVVFFELISGRRPFEDSSASAVQIAHLTTPAPSLLSVDPELPAGCDAMVQKLLAKDPADRYQNCAALLQDLIAHGAHAGAGALRPQIRPELQEAIAATESMPLNERTSAARGVVQTDAERTVLAETPAARSTSAGPAGETRFAEKKGRPVWIAAAALGAVVLAAAIGMFVLHSAKTFKSSATAVQDHPQSPPQVYSDDHGRMLLVSAGTFHFGQAGASGAKVMELPAYYIDETEVSNAEYRRFCEATGHAAPQNGAYSAHPDYPVSGVSYEDAVAYASWAGKRLPTEAEWEKAARGKDERAFPWGDGAWTSDVPEQLQAVTSEPERRSPYGAYNMAGNVWEWTESRYTPQPSDIEGMKRLLHGAKFSSTWEVIKGGSFSPGGSDNFAISSRRGLPTDARSPWIGFRCARDVTSVPR